MGLGKEVGVQTLHTGDLHKTPVQTEDAGVQTVSKPFFPPFSLLETQGPGGGGGAGDGGSSVFVINDQSSAEETCDDVEIVDCYHSCTAHKSAPDDTGGGVVARSSVNVSKKGSASPSSRSSRSRRGRKPVKELPGVKCMSKASPESIIDMLQPLLLQHHSHTDPDPFFDSLNRSMIASSSLMAKSLAEEPSQVEGPHEKEIEPSSSSDVKAGPKKKPRQRGKQKSAAKETKTPQQGHLEEVINPETVGSGEKGLQGSNTSDPSSSTEPCQAVPKRDGAPKSAKFWITDDPSTLLGFLQDVSVVLCRSEVEEGGCSILRQRLHSCVAGDVQKQQNVSSDNPPRKRKTRKRKVVVEVSCSSEGTATASEIDASLLPVKKREVAQ